MLKARSPQPSDWAHFYQLAEAEGWKVPQIERQLFRTLWSQDVLALQDEGAFCGLISAVPHQRSGWIGNLIVPSQLRGRGYGRQLFELAMTELTAAGMESIWLTASEQGRPLYEQYGFVTVDRIERCFFPLRQEGMTVSTVEVASKAELFAADRLAWQEDRQAMLEPLVAGGEVFASGGAVALLQQGADVQIIGPWYSRSPAFEQNCSLLSTVLKAADPAIPLVADLLVSSPQRDLFSTAGAVCTGQTTLMCHGNAALADLKKIMTLACLGSVG